MTIGRIVHYVSYGTPGGEYTSTCRPAIVTEVLDMKTGVLCVFNPKGIFFNESHYDENKSPGTWHWCTECVVMDEQSEMLRGFRGSED